MEGTHNVTTKRVFVTHAGCSTLVIIFHMSVGSMDTAGWEKGVLYGEGQNLARFLMESPANHITPTVFANTIEEKLAPHAKFVAVEKRFVLDLTVLSSLLLAVLLTSIIRLFLFDPKY